MRGRKPGAGFSERRTLLLVDLGHDVEVDETNDDVATDIDGADGVEHIGVLERDALRHLHHTEDDDQVGTVLILLANACRNGCTVSVLFCAWPPSRQSDCMLYFAIAIKEHGVLMVGSVATRGKRIGVSLHLGAETGHCE